MHPKDLLSSNAAALNSNLWPRKFRACELAASSGELGSARKHYAPRALRSVAKADVVERDNDLNLDNCSGRANASCTQI